MEVIFINPRFEAYWLAHMLKANADAGNESLTTDMGERWWKGAGRNKHNIWPKYFYFLLWYFSLSQCHYKVSNEHFIILRSKARLLLMLPICLLYYHFIVKAFMKQTNKQKVIQMKRPLLPESL